MATVSRSKSVKQKEVSVEDVTLNKLLHTNRKARKEHREAALFDLISTVEDIIRARDKDQDTSYLIDVMEKALGYYTALTGEK